jgi:hypothetical protein
MCFAQDYSFTLALASCPDPAPGRCESSIAAARQSCSAKCGFRQWIAVPKPLRLTRWRADHRAAAVEMAGVAQATTTQKAEAALSSLSGDRGGAFGSHTECMDCLEHGYGPFVAYSELVDNGG